MKVANNVLIFAAIVFSVTLLCIVGLVIAGRDIDSVIYLLAAVLLPTITGLVTGKNQAEKVEAVAEQVRETTEKVETVHGLVNGNTSRLLAIAESKGYDMSEARAGLVDAGWVDPGE